MKQPRGAGSLWTALHRSVFGVVGRIVDLLLVAVPPGRRATIAGWPDTEGNSIEVLRRLLIADDRPVTWLVADISMAPFWALSDISAAKNLQLRRKRSIGGIFAYLRSDVVFFTHGLYQSRPSRRGRVFVNLWHGDGPKGHRLPGGTTIACDVLVSGTQLWGHLKANQFAGHDLRILVVGNPRIDQYDRPAPAAALRLLGLEPDRPIVAWLPTFRSALRVGPRAGWKDVGDEARGAPGGAKPHWRTVAAAAAERGVQVVVKPHPLDHESYEEYGFLALNDRALADAGVGLYQLLARADALITDYSSVWTDYLVLDRPLAFYMPDYAAYENGRGFNIDNLPDVIPGPVLESTEDWLGWIDKIAEHTDLWAGQRAHSATSIGLVQSLGASQRVLDAVLGADQIDVCLSGEAGAAVLHGDST
ncbi:MAG: CDP-glycerol glycerophosphotransferase family protein [Pseudonocardiales bacterium]